MSDREQRQRKSMVSDQMVASALRAYAFVMFFIARTP